MGMNRAFPVINLPRMRVMAGLLRLIPLWQNWRASNTDLAGSATGVVAEAAEASEQLVNA